MSQGATSKVVLVAFGGPSSSGKTTVATTLTSLLPHVTLVQLDDFYLTDSEIPIDATTGYQNWDCPQALDFDKFTSYLKALKNGTGESPVESVQSKDVDLSLSSSELETIESVIASQNDKFQGKHIVFVDGFMLFHDPEVIKLFDIKLFFHASFETLKKRRESRKGYTTVEGFWVDPPDYFEKIVWPAFVDSHKYLFKDEDMEGNLKPSSTSAEYKINDIANEESSTLFSLVNKSLDAIIEDL
ncbi:uncharacterized protein LODBEIA_P15750 [Lodderomyces beijingensis]|uniref:Phosphoribulokinase/uridine kinase domain-containing protein n=1 Tax=Lodderomyces beijingensis TaxID=1775926 RepID=A0ABP0ZKF0_9ASCO